jgi:hypothetical protein
VCECVAILFIVKELNNNYDITAQYHSLYNSVITSNLNYNSFSPGKGNLIREIEVFLSKNFTLVTA